MYPKCVLYLIALGATPALASQRIFQMPNHLKHRLHARANVQFKNFCSLRTQNNKAVEGHEIVGIVLGGGLGAIGGGVAAGASYLTALHILDQGEDPHIKDREEARERYNGLKLFTYSGMVAGSYNCMKICDVPPKARKLVTAGLAGTLALKYALNHDEVITREIYTGREIRP